MIGNNPNYYYFLLCRIRPTSCDVESILIDDRSVSLVGECDHESFGSSMVVGVVEGLRVDQEPDAVVHAIFNAFDQLEMQKSD